MPDTKRLMDLAIGVPALMLSLPLQASVAILVRTKLGRPVLFRQQRPGLHGVPFEMVKFRTMVDPDLTHGLISDDQRMTPLGAFLRSTSLDELPALVHVVRGQMSLVGPRPLLVRYLDRYSPEQARGHSVRPGLTGLAQINGRNATTWERRLALDVEYVDTRSLRLDLKILWRTLVIVLTRHGVSGDGTSTMPEFFPTAHGAGS
jgi:lipopolysaccharide/colanic/teichoic acid biosynthesis glycosyltransferase